MRSLNVNGRDWRGQCWAKLAAYTYSDPYDDVVDGDRDGGGARAMLLPARI
jgi:hypothetical protein